MLQYRELSAEERAVYYNEKLQRDFPPDELKPCATIDKLCAEGIYHCYAFFDHEAQIGYAYLKMTGEFTLLDYLAIEPSCRGKGYGSQVLPIITGELLPEGNTLLIEAENPACATSLDDRAVRLARLRFYKNAGMRVSGVLGKAFGVEYRILTGGAERSDSEIANGMMTSYAEMFSDPIFKKNVTIWIP